jgi:phosphatidylglycerophosphate synthase
MDGIKISKEYENPIDYKLYELSEYVSEYLHNIKIFTITPNTITIFGIFISFLSIYALWNNYYIISITLLFFRHFLDCLDGYYARKYNMQSEFGDYLDHISDLFTFISIFLILLYKLKKIEKLVFLILTAFLSLISLIQIGCQEIIYDNKNDKNSSLKQTKKLCFNTNFIHFTKYFANGTCIIILSFIIIYIKIR